MDEKSTQDTPQAGLPVPHNGHDVKQQARRLGDAVKRRAIATSEGKKTEFADKLGAIVDKLEGIAGPHEGSEAGMQGQFIDRGVAMLRRFQSTLSDNSTQELIHKAEEQVKARPGLFIAGCLALGFFGARLVRR
jgi:hypothetical protein